MAGEPKVTKGARSAPVAWREDLDPPGEGEEMRIIGHTWKPHRLFDTPPVPFDQLVKSVGTRRKAMLFSPVTGQWAYANVLYPKDEPVKIRVWGGPRGLTLVEASASFTSPIVIPTLYGREGAPEGRSHTTWMSYTPHEVFSQQDQLDAAVGRVLVGGLGMGWFLDRVARLPQVESVVVVEKSEELLQWYGWAYVRELEKRVGKAVKVVLGDVYEFMEASGPVAYDACLLDIWLGGTDSAWDRTMLRYVERGWNVSAWGCPPYVLRSPAEARKWRLGIDRKARENVGKDDRFSGDDED